MKKLLLVVTALLLLMLPAMADTIDLSGMTREELVALRDRIDDQIETLDAIAATAGEPDYTAMPLEDAFAAIGAASANSDCTYRSYEYWETNHYVIHIDLDTPFTYSSGLSNAIKYTIDFGRRAYPLPEVATLRFVFHQQTNTGKDGTPIIWKITEATFNRMNIEYYYEHTYTASKSFMNACDSAAVQKVYKDAAE